MKNLTPLLAVFTALALVGCAKPKKTEEVAECVFPQTKERAPMWVCDAPVEGVRLSAVGTWQKTGAGIGFQKDQATLDGRVKLAQQMRTFIANKVQQFAATTGSGTTETVDQVASSVSKGITAETLKGSKVFRTAYAADGRVYVLVGMDPTTTEEAGKAALQTSMNNDRAQWQQFQGAKAAADLSAEIYKMGEQKMR
jgi:hypothetical protein